MLCSTSGYLHKFIVYTGADTRYVEPDVLLPQEFEKYTNPSRVVLSLMDGNYNKGHKLALDNLYTSPELLHALFENGTNAFGTLRKKEALPKEFWKWKPPKGFGEQPIIKFCNSYMVCRWNDAYKSKKDKIVSMMSTVHTGKIT